MKKLIHSILAIFLFGIGATVIAQPSLPDLDPNEVEIRSKLEIKFPQLPRPSFDVLVPPPASYKLPTNRMPLLGSSWQNGSMFPQSTLGNPILADRSSLAQASPKSFSLEAGAGRNLARRALLEMYLPFSPQTNLVAEIDYEGSDGHEPFPETPLIKAPYDALNALVGFERVGEAFSTALKVHSFWDKFTLFGADTTGTSPLLLNPQPTREGVGWGSLFSLSSRANSLLPFELLATYDLVNYDTGIFDESVRIDDKPRVLDFAEKQLDASGKVELPFSDTFKAFLVGNTTIGGLNTDAYLASDHFTYDAGAGINLSPSPYFKLSLGAKVAGYDASDKNTGSEKISKSLILPVARLDVYPSTGVHLYVKQEPKTTAFGLTEMIAFNPFVVHNPILLPEIGKIDVEGGFGLTIETFSMNLKAGYQEMEQRLFFEPTEQLLYENFNGFFEPKYAPSKQMFAGLDLSIHLLQKIRFAVEATYQDGSLLFDDDQTTIIPYLPTYQGKASFRWSFAKQKGTINLEGRFMGERFTDLAETASLPGFIDGDFRIDYKLLEGVSVFGEVNHMGNTNMMQWIGYPTEQFGAIGGVRLTL